MSTTCEILFDNNSNKVFYSGQFIQGTVTLSLVKEKAVKGIFIDVIGEAECRWCEHVKQQRLTYRGHEVYLTSKTYFVGFEDCADTHIVPAGINTYTFSCQLPQNIPTSFEGTYGSIRYKAVVTLNIPIWPDKTYWEGFTVIKCHDLNDLSSDLRNTISIERSETYSAWCFIPFIKAKLLTIIATIPATGYAPGQTIEITLDILNSSNTSVNRCNVCLLRIVSYCATQRGNRHKTEYVRYSEVQTIGYAGNCTQKVNVSLIVPPGPPTDLETSTVCRIRYEVEIRVDVGRCHDCLVLKIPITIGTFPLIENSPSGGIENRLSVISYDSDLPSYEQAIKLNPPPDGAEITYVPLYPIVELQRV